METATTNGLALSDSILGDFSSYFRWNEERRQYQINRQIDPRVEREDWVDIPSSARDPFCDPTSRIPVGNIVYRLANEILRANQLSDRISILNRQREAALAAIGQRLIDESERRNWCSEFDEIIEEVNAELPHGWELPTRKRSYEVEVTVTGKITTTTTVTVEATSEDEACDMVNEDTESHVDLDEVLTDASRNETFEIDSVEVSAS